MYFRLQISDYLTIEAAFAGIPAGVTSLDLGGNGLDTKTGAELAQAFASIPAGVTSLNLAWNDLHLTTGAELAVAFVAIPAGVTSLDLGENDLDTKTGAELAQALAAIPAGVTSLNLGANGLGHKTGAELAQAFAAIPAGVTSINLAWNSLGHRTTGAELAQAFASIPAGVTSLDLAWNSLGHRTGAELAQAFASIPAGVTSLDLGRNDLGAKTGAELAQAFASIPAGVTSLDLGRNDLGAKAGAELAVVFAAIPAGITVTLKGNNLFTNKTHAEKDPLLIALRQANPNINLDLSGNGESDAQRALAPLACLAKKPMREQGASVPTDVLIYILSFLLPKDTSLPRTYKMFSDAFNIVNLRPSINNRLMIGHAFSLESFNKYFDIPQHPKGVLLIKDAEAAPNERNIPKEEHPDWFKFMFNILAMKETQLAAIALGTIILLSCGGVGMMVLGGGLVTAGAAGLAMNFFSPNETRNDTGHEEAPSHTA